MKSLAGNLQTVLEPLVPGWWQKKKRTAWFKKVKVVDIVGNNRIFEVEIDGLLQCAVEGGKCSEVYDGSNSRHYKVVQGSRGGWRF